jgi:hypothetical protein
MSFSASLTWLGFLEPSDVKVFCDVKVYWRLIRRHFFNDQSFGGGDALSFRS